MGRLTAGMLSVSVPYPKAELGFSGSFVFSWLTFDLRTGASSGLPCCFARFVWSKTSIWDVWESLMSNLVKCFLRSVDLIVPKCVCFLDACWGISCFCLRLRPAVNLHLSPEWHHPSCEKALGIQYSVQRMKCCICKNKNPYLLMIIPASASCLVWGFFLPKL